MIGATTLLEVSTLGWFEVRRQDTPLSGGNWSRRKVCELFKLLLSVEQHRLHREQIQEILWPASTIEQAANSFGKTLYLLRRALEPDLPAGRGSASLYVHLDRDTLMLIPDNLQIDADLFESSAKQLQVRMRDRSGKGQGNSNDFQLLGEFDRVLTLYTGDYLPEDLYEDWTQRRRDRLRRIHSWLLENAAELAVASGKGQQAIEYLQTLLEHNSADEQTHCQLMLVYARMGRRKDAVNQHQLLRQALREELQTSPLPETVELYRNIQSGRIAVDLDESWRGSGGSRGNSARPVSGPLPDVAVEVTTSKSDPPARSEKNGYALQLASQSGNERTLLTDVEVEQFPQRKLDPDRILKAELVGRAEEISRLQHAYNQAYAGQRRVVFICGEPGIGKTRLAREFTHWGEETQQATVLWGYCYEMSGQLPYQPVADAISAHVRMCSPEQLRSLLGNSAVDLAKIVPEVRFKLPELPQPEPLGPEPERRNLYNAVAHYFNALVAEHPLVIILDDLQWADTATMQLLSFLTLQGAGVSPFDSVTTPNKNASAPLYLMLYRPDAVHETHPLRGLIASLARGGMGEELRPQRLTEEQVQQLLVNMAGHTVHPSFAGEIYRHTEGNPFFIGEVIRSLIFEGKIRWTGERWQATVKVSELAIPQSVRLLIERRLAHLSPDCRTTLTLAAVLGRHFSSELLCQARGLSEDVVAEHIDNAISAQLLASHSHLVPGTRVESGSHDHGSDVDLAFTHDKIREVLYQWLNPLRRRTLHRQVAQAIEARYAARLPLYYSTLAYHYRMSEDVIQAVDYLQKAADQAKNVSAMLDAIDYISTALDLLIGDEERSRRAALLRQLSELHLYAGRLDEAIRIGLASCTLWRDLGDVVKEVETRLDVSFCFHWMGRESEAIEHIQRALECLETKPEEIRLIAKAYSQWGLAATVMGDPVQARDKLQHASELHVQIGGDDPFISVVSLWSQSWCAFLAGSPRQMLEYALCGVETCNQSRKPDWEPMMDYSAAWAYMLLGQLADGERAARTAFEKAQKHGVVGAQGWANLVLAFLAIQAARWEEAEQSSNAAYSIAAMLRDADLQARVLWSRSLCAGWRDDWECAIADAKTALQIAQQEGETSMVFPYLLMQTAKAHFYAGKLEEAQSYLNQAMELAESRQYQQLPAIGQRLQGRIWQAQGRFDEAQPCFERSLTELSAIDDVVERARTEEAYGLFYLARGKGDDAERGEMLIESARGTFQRLGVNG